MEKQFKRLRDHEKINLLDYVKTYIKENPETELLIGTDSQNHRKNTTYAIVIALYKPGKGAHALYSRWDEPRYIFGKPGEAEKMRLLAEVGYSIEIAEALRNQIGLKAKYIDIDINPDKRYASNVALTEALGYVRGMGYEPRWKRSERSPMITYAADNLVK
jgi:predicted RNase H-related nuclease YkuK (DUF458 family)